MRVRRVPEAVREVLKRNNLKTEDIDWFVLHQANRRIVEDSGQKAEDRDREISDEPSEIWKHLFRKYPDTVK